MQDLTMQFYTLLIFCGAGAWGLNITGLEVPLYADPRRAAELTCHFSMDQHRLHSVKWYRDMDEIFRYNPSQHPSIRLFNVSGLSVTEGECSAQRCRVRVLPPPVAARAAYTCEVSTEGPKFHIATLTKHMTVLAMPQRDPVITGASRAQPPGRALLLNCSADYSLPPADLLWYIDDQLVEGEAGQSTEVSEAVEGGLRASWRVLRVSVPQSGALRVRCEARLRVLPPVSRDTSLLLTPQLHATLSKYTASTGVLRKPRVGVTFVMVTLLKVLTTS